jgi:hypothetical protein
VKLASLRDRGILSAEEFEEQEAMLLGSSPLGSRVAVEDVEDKPSETKLKMMGRWSRQIRSTLTTTAAPTFVNAWRSDAIAHSTRRRVMSIHVRCRMWLPKQR